MQAKQYEQAIKAADLALAQSSSCLNHCLLVEVLVQATSETSRILSAWEMVITAPDRDAATVSRALGCLLSCDTISGHVQEKAVRDAFQSTPAEQIWQLCLGLISSAVNPLQLIASVVKYALASKRYNVDSQSCTEFDNVPKQSHPLQPSTEAK
jgi:hypothetical protein